jgi:hypothetical protein
MHLNGVRRLKKSRKKHTLSQMMKNLINVYFQEKYKILIINFLENGIKCKRKFDSNVAGLMSFCGKFLCLESLDFCF